MPERHASPATAVHPLIHAGKWLLADLLATLMFVGCYALTHSIAAANGAGIALGLGQIGWFKIRGIPVDLMQWLSLFLVIVFGGAALLTNNPIFILLKPTLIYAAVGAVMLRRGWMTRYLPPLARARAGDVTTAFGYVWASLMFATAGANLALAFYAGPAAVFWFLGVFPIASKVALVAVQYSVTRAVVRRRVRGYGGPAVRTP
jgi:intracellular septation protein A